MDILFLPRIESPASASSSPFKMFEYLAVGKPCIYGGIPIPTDFKPLVYEVSEGDYAEAIGDAMEEVRGDKPSLKQHRQQYALKHTWEQRIDKTIRLIQG